MSEPNPYISGTFTQSGKEYDGATFARRDVRAVVALRCECGKPLVTAAAAPDAVTCVNRECRFYEIVYRVVYPTVYLEAVQDKAE